MDNLQPNISKVVRVINQVSNIVDRYIDLKDEYIDENFTETIGDISACFKIFKRGTEVISNHKTLAFIKGLKDAEINEDQLETLMNTTKDRKKAQYICDILSKVVFSNSIEAIELIGILTGMVLNNSEGNIYKELICVNMLKDTFDFDIENLIFIDAYLVSEEKIWFDTEKLYEMFDDNGIDIVCAMSTVQKCMASQIIAREGDPLIESDDIVQWEQRDDDEVYCFTPAGQLLRRLVRNLYKIN